MNARDLKAAIEDPRADWFTVQLIRLILKADDENRFRLGIVYPVVVEAVRIYKREGIYTDETKSFPDYDAIVAKAEKNIKSR